MGVSNVIKKPIYRKNRIGQGEDIAKDKKQKSHTFVWL
jgi:hypothetical protein